jgi:hypothetical protein
MMSVDGTPPPGFAIEEPLDTPYGDRQAMVRDPSGNLFQLAHRTATP